MRLEAFFDCETRSDIDLKTAGVWRYVQSEHTDVIMATYAIADGPVFTWYRGSKPPYDLCLALADNAILYIHNLEFDFIVWNTILHGRHGWPKLMLDQCRCTAAMASAMALPRSLDGAARALRLTVEKDSDGSKLMKRMCKPAGWTDDLLPTWHETTGDLARLETYARTDIHVLRPLRNRMLDLRPKEQALFSLTHRINARGVRTDLQAVRKAIPMVQAANAELAQRIRGLTGGQVRTAMQRDKLLAFLADHLVVLPNARRRTLEIFQATATEIPEACDAVIDTRLEAAKTSVGKLSAMVMRTNLDGRLRGALVYHGAATGRYTSHGVQLQNLPRPSMSFALCCQAIEVIRSGRRDDLEFLFGATLQVISDCLRSFFIPEPGAAFVVADYSKVEAIVNAWCAGEYDLLQAFRNGTDVYADMASTVYGRLIDRKHDKIEGQVGKALILGAGYGMGPARFWESCILAGIPITLAFAEQAISAYRRRNGAIVQHWYDQERAAMDAIASPGRPVDCGAVVWLSRSGVLWCRLPSGRALAYPYPQIRDMKDRHGILRPRLVHWGLHPLTKRWSEVSTYGSALVENIVQGIARDCLTDAMLDVEPKGVDCVLTVHDELVAESRLPSLTYDVVMESMNTAPDWAPGLPLSANGAVMERYGKME